jgi:type I restriction enzyme S subunit
VVFGDHTRTLKYVDFDFVVGAEGVKILVTKPCVLPKFLYYYLQSVEVRSLGYSRHFRLLKELLVGVPPLPEQHRIVALLDEAFAGIAKARENTERNLENAREVFESHLNALYERPGAGWQVRRVGEIAEHVLGKMLDKNKNKGEPRPYLRNINVRWFDIDLSDLLEMRFLPTETDRYTAVNGDVLICEGGYPGRAAIWQGDQPIYFQKALHRVRFPKPGLNEWFVFYLYAQDRSDALRDHFSGTGIQHFTGEVLDRFPVPIPPDGALPSLLDSIKNLQAETQRLTALYQRKLAALDALKQSLLHQAFHGDL